MRTKTSGKKFAIQVRTFLWGYFGVTRTTLTHCTELNSVPQQFMPFLAPQNVTTFGNRVVVADLIS